jgi:integrase
VAKRRFQKGRFEVINGTAYTLYYKDVQGPDGSLTSKRVRRFIGNLPEMSERAARREHDKFMQSVNAVRGSVPPTIKGQTFQNAVDAWRQAVAPNLSPATVRQRESYLKTHILPAFGSEAIHAVNIPAVQQFATNLRGKLSRKTILNVVGSIIVILEYAEKSGSKISRVRFKDLALGSPVTAQQPFFTKEEATAVIDAAPEPYKTLFAVAWMTGARAGEILALTVGDLDFSKKTISISKSADDNTRIVRQPKTKNSVAVLPMPSALEGMLRSYLNNWTPNPTGWLFANRKGTHPRWRDNVVKYGLKPILRKLGIPEKDAGLHCFRHGLATELAERSVPVTVLQQQMRHADVRTTLRVYAHAIPQSQRDAMESVGAHSIGTLVPIGTETAA